MNKEREGIEKIGRILENPKYQRFVLLQLISLGLIFLIVIIYLSINNDILLHDFLVDNGLITISPKKIDGVVNLTNLTYMNYTT